MYIYKPLGASFHEVLIPLAAKVQSRGDDDVGKGTRWLVQHVLDLVAGLVAHPVVDDALGLFVVVRKVHANDLALVDLLAHCFELITDWVSVLIFEKAKFIFYLYCIM